MDNTKGNIVLLLGLQGLSIMCSSFYFLMEFLVSCMHVQFLYFITCAQVVCYLDQSSFY